MKYILSTPNRIELLLLIVGLVLFVVYTRPPTNVEIKKECEQRAEDLRNKIELVDNSVRLNSFTLLYHNKVQKRMEAVLDEYLKIEEDIQRVKALSDRIDALTNTDDAVCDYPYIFGGTDE